MKSWFEVSGYRQEPVESGIKKVKFSQNRNTQKKSKVCKGVPFVMMYHLMFKSIGKVINKNLNLLYMDNEVKKVFTPWPMISFGSARKLNSYIVRVKVYPFERILGSYKCRHK